MNSKGFTLTELLVVIFIITILSSISFAYYRRGEREFALSRSAFKLAQDIRRAQEMAMSVKEVGPAGAKIVPSGGYGIYFKKNPDEIILFADCNNNQKYTPGNVCGDPPNKFSEKIEDIDLEAGVEIKNLLPSSPLNISFRPPDPIVFVPGGSGTIILSLKTDPTKTKTIRINEAGLIYVE